MTRAPGLRRTDAVLNSHLQHAWHRAGVERLDPHLSIEREQRIFMLISRFDPTTQGKYLAWLSAWRRRWWVDHGLRTCCDMFELDRLASGLRHFHDVRRHLPTELRDINRFETSDELLGVEAHPHRVRLEDPARGGAGSGSCRERDPIRWRTLEIGPSQGRRGRQVVGDGHAMVHIRPIQQSVRALCGQRTVAGTHHAVRSLSVGRCHARIQELG